MNQPSPEKIKPSDEVVLANVRAALAEDVGSGDITAALIPAAETARARVITRENGVLCGRAWVDRVFTELDASIVLDWQAADGDAISAGDLLFTVSGPARGLLTGERSALNFLQLLSGTATVCAHYASLVSGHRGSTAGYPQDHPRPAYRPEVRRQLWRLLQPPHRSVRRLPDQGKPHSRGGGIARAVQAARQFAPGKPVEVEVESLEELEQALAAGCDRIMLDNFSLAQMASAVALSDGRVELEASGNVTGETLRPIAETGVDYISIGALTKDCKALDLSMRLL